MSVIFRRFSDLPWFEWKTKFCWIIYWVYIYLCYWIVDVISCFLLSSIVLALVRSFGGCYFYCKNVCIPNFLARMLSFPSMKHLNTFSLLRAFQHSCEAVCTRELTCVWETIALSYERRRSCYHMISEHFVTRNVRSLFVANAMRNFSSDLVN